MQTQARTTEREGISRHSDRGARGGCRRRSPRRIAWGVALALIGAAACDEVPEAPPRPQSGLTQGEPQGAAEAVAEVREVGDEVDVAGLAAAVGRRAAALPRPTPALAKALAAVDEGGATVGEVYKDGRLWFYQEDGNLSADGEAAMALLGDIERHGLSRRGFRFEAVDAATARVVEAFAGQRARLLALAADGHAARTLAAIVGWLRTGKGDELALREAGAEHISGRQRAAMAKALPAIVAAVEETRAAVYTADVVLMAAAVRYLVEFTLARPLHPHEPTSAAEVRRLADREGAALLARLRGKRGALAAAMRAAWPTHPQYQKLLAAQDRYQALVTAGGWPQLPALAGDKLERGARGSVVAAVRARLAVEGHEVGEGDVYDDALVKAVQTFQRQHQVLDDGVVAPATLRELNVTASARLQQLRLALGRWREAHARDAESFHIWVDVAAQRMQVYEGGKPIREHRVIVGKDDEDIDYEQRLKGRINRTKLFGAKMNKITLAPRWYPTQRVIDIELGPQLAKDPDYYEKQGYVSEMKADGTETVYQRSGPTNLLGVVKFQFPNKHAIYMHDTPSKALFKKPRRAYSHGCVRLDQPFALAAFLLGRDKGWSKQKIKKIIDEREEHVVNLKTSVPVYIDYITVTVEEDGGVSFWGDIYGYDRAALTGAVPVEEVEPYKPASTRGLL